MLPACEGLREDISTYILLSNLRIAGDKAYTLSPAGVQIIYLFAQYSSRSFWTSELVVFNTLAAS